MSYHNQETQQRRDRDYHRTELMSLGEQLRDVEAKLNDASRRLSIMERILTERYGTVQADANALAEG